MPPGEIKHTQYASIGSNKGQYREKVTRSKGPAGPGLVW